jgi:molybdate transport system substrate-binding protein
MSGCPASQKPTLQIFAASSLTEVFRDLKREFEKQNPAARVTLNFAGSQVLRLQWEQGSHADLFASADQSHSKALAKAGLLKQPQRFAFNKLAVIVPRKRSQSIQTLRDLSRLSSLVIGTPQVPIGHYTQLFFSKTAKVLGPDFSRDLKRKIVSQEKNVRLVRAKVELGHVDAAIVYKTDALASKHVVMLPLPRSLHVSVTCTIGLHPRAKQPLLANKWLVLLRSARGKALLQKRGFVVP